MLKTWVKKVPELMIENRALTPRRDVADGPPTPLEAHVVRARLTGGGTRPPGASILVAPTPCMIWAWPSEKNREPMMRQTGWGG